MCEETVSWNKLDGWVTLKIPGQVTDVKPSIHAENTNELLASWYPRFTGSSFI